LGRPVIQCAPFLLEGAFIALVNMPDKEIKS